MPDRCVQQLICEGNLVGLELTDTTLGRNSFGEKVVVTGWHVNQMSHGGPLNQSINKYIYMKDISLSFGRVKMCHLFKLQRVNTEPGSMIKNG